MTSSSMTALKKQALRQLATDAHELGIIKRYTKGIEANKRFAAIATPLTMLALLDDLEAAEKRIAELEARTVTFPDERFRYGESDYDDGFVNGWNAHGIEAKSALRAAGIGVKGE
ncbi:ead/Ea22-like family protein [Citrobacter sp. Cpo113]|uniref:ead/Ea22-like family protein n=1 Tax=Citrobacter sp. Cpo113 TaxID=2985146 RepID=UPI002575B95B|nr:ead/Ea22-like family protein [Citrobacter sp. Cpo113]MDM2789473.1 ead/Ea22-like family protein [Citrobacter sp. Cpo113]